MIICSATAAPFYALFLCHFCCFCCCSATRLRAVSTCNAFFTSVSYAVARFSASASAVNKIKQHQRGRDASHTRQHYIFSFLSRKNVFFFISIQFICVLLNSSGVITMLLPSAAHLHATLRVKSTSISTDLMSSDGRPSPRSLQTKKIRRIFLGTKIVSFSCIALA